MKWKAVVKIREFSVWLLFFLRPHGKKEIEISFR